MNIKQIDKQLGKELRFRPLPIRIDPAGTRLPPSDDRWRLEQILEKPARLRLVNIHTGHFVELQTDNIREYRSPDFLLLRCQLVIAGNDIHIEPIHQATEMFARLEHQIPALLSEMRNDLAQFPLRREIVLLKRSWTYWAKGNELIYYFDDYPELISQFQILVGNRLVTEITYNNVSRYLMSEELARYLGA